MSKRRRRPHDPLASQPRSPVRRPGDFNQQTEAQLDPNVEFLAANSSAVGGDPTHLILRILGAIRRAVARR